MKKFFLYGRQAKNFFARFRVFNKKTCSVVRLENQLKIVYRDQPRLKLLQFWPTIRNCKMIVSMFLITF